MSNLDGGVCGLLHGPEVIILFACIHCIVVSLFTPLGFWKDRNKIETWNLKLDDHGLIKTSTNEWPSLVSAWLSGRLLTACEDPSITPTREVLPAPTEEAASMFWHVVISRCDLSPTLSRCDPRVRRGAVLRALPAYARRSPNFRGGRSRVEAWAHPQRIVEGRLICYD